MSRQYNPAIDAYKNMDIENLPKDEPEAETGGLLTRKPANRSGGLDMTNPAVRVAKSMQVLRKHRNEIKDGN
jgi:hypothetical protein